MRTAPEDWLVLLGSYWHSLAQVSFHPSLADSYDVRTQGHNEDLGQDQ